MVISSNSSIMAMMPPVKNISKDIISQSDKNSDSALSIDELGIDESQFNSLDSDSDGLVTQDEIASAIDSKLSSSFEDGQIPSKEEFASMLSEMGLKMPPPPDKQGDSSSKNDEFATQIISSFDSNGDSLLSSDEVSMLDSEEFSTLDSDGDGSISQSELTSAFEQVSKNGTPPPPPPGGGGMQQSSSDEDESYSSLDTNQDGIISQEEKDAALGLDSSSTSNSSSQDVMDSLKLLMDAIKLNSESSENSLDLNNFKNMMKISNNATNNSDLNTYLTNSSKNSSSTFNYA